MSREFIRQGVQEIVRRLAENRARVVMAPTGAPRSGQDLPKGFHVHKSWQIQTALAGRYDILFAHDRITVAPGVFLLIPPLIVHTPIEVCRGVPHERLSLFQINMDFAAVKLRVKRRRNNVTYRLSLEERRVWTEQLMVPPAPFMDRVALLRSGAERALADQYLRAHLVVFFYSLADMLKRPDVAAPAPVPVAVQLAQDYIESHYFNLNLSLREIARAANVSPSYLTHLYRQVTGCNLWQSVIARRLENAYALLRTGAYRVKQACFLTGWSSQSYFCTAFRKRFKKPPSRIPLRRPIP